MSLPHMRPVVCNSKTLQYLYSWSEGGRFATRDFQNYEVDLFSNIYWHSIVMPTNYHIEICRNRI